MNHQLNLGSQQGDLLEQFTGCSPANPTMASYEQKVKEHSSFSVPQGWVSQLIFSMCWNPEEVGSNASEVKDAITKQGQTDNEQIFFLSLCSSRKCGPSCIPVSIFGLKVCVFLNQDPN